MDLWSGRFEEESDPAFRAINDSLRVDHRLVREDIEGSLAWARALEAAGVLTSDEADRIRTALRSIADLADREPERVREAGEEDVHTWVEAQLVERIGSLGKKLHTGRSRNDQVSTDLRLWTRRQIGQRRQEIHAVQESLVRMAAREEETVIPGYTHLQRAQPVLLSHWCLAYFEMLARDDARLADALKRLDRCPLGAAALVGTAYPIDRHALAESLGFSAPTANSLDATADRDFVVEALSALSLCAVHLSRLAEDLIFYSSGEARFVHLDDSTASGSSIMPQKKNPDALELVRGKTGRILGALLSLAVTLKGLPLAYNKDMQEDKEPLFDAMESLSLCLKVMPPLLDRLRVDRDRTRQAAMADYSNATELADYLAVRGVPFRDAHEQVGRIVLRATELNLTLEQMPLEEMAAIAPDVGPDVRDHLTIDAALSKRDVFGGTAPNRVRDAIRDAKVRLRPHAAPEAVAVASAGPSACGENAEPSE
jgi:argininosuccinate lyase/amino-acid N-acetyltransferase